MPTTSNFGWTTPADTDLVKDGAAAIRTLGNGIDTSLVDLKGGTTGQILSKTSNTDMDFTWVANDVGDITEVTVSSPLTGGGSSGSVNVAIQDGTTAQKGAVQLEDSTSSTSTTKAATPNSVKTSYDLANAAIPKSLVDAKADLITATADNTPARLAVGANDTVLVAASGETTGLKWGGGWGTYTPTLTNVTQGNGTLTARYAQIGKTVHLEVNFTLGSTSAITGAPRITLPVTAKLGGYTFLGTTTLGDFGTASYVGFSILENTSQFYLASLNASGTYGVEGAVSSTAPFTWTTNDYFTIRATYEAA